MRWRMAELHHYVSVDLSFALQPTRAAPDGQALMDKTVNVETLVSSAVSIFYIYTACRFMTYY